MNVQKIDGTSFQSRNQTIRFADDIARHVNKCYPRISLTKLKSFENAEQYASLIDKITEKFVKNIRHTKDDIYDDADSFCKKIKAFIKPVMQYGLGNCGENAQLASIVAKVNGIKDCHIAHLYTTKERDLDHAVLFINAEKPYIIDSWFGFTDYVPNALNKYKTLYRNIFKDYKEEDTMTFVSYTDDEYTYFLKDNFTRKQINKLKRMYPQIFIKRGYV